MAASRLAWIAIASVVGLLVAGFVTYFAVNAGGSPGPTPTVQATTTTEVPTTPPPLTEPPTETAPAPTQEPTEPPGTETPTPLPPPPPRPENPPVITNIEPVVGGQWYQFGERVVFFLPPGWSFSVGVAAADPGGPIISIVEPASQSVLVFSYQTLTESDRTVLDPALDPVFDQIRDTLSLR